MNNASIVEEHRYRLPHRHEPTARQATVNHGSIELEFLGEFQAHNAAGETLNLTSKKARAVLAVLAVQSPASISRDALCDLLWSDQDELRARQSLRQAVAAIRRDIGPVVLNRGNALALDTLICRTDIGEVRKLAGSDLADSLSAAADFYRNEFLEGIGIHDPSFDHWLRDQREHWRKVACSVLAQLADQHVRSNAQEQAVTVFERWVRLDPYAEAAHRGLMRRLWAKGDRRGALQQFEQCKQVLRHGLNAEPSAETVALYQELRCSSSLSDTARAIAATQHLSLAVLAPVNAAGSSAMAPLADWIVRGLATAFACYPGLSVRATPFSASANSDLRELAQEMEVNYVVTSALRSGGQGKVRLSVQLLAAREVRYVWGTQVEFDESISNEALDEMVASAAAGVEKQLIMAAAKEGQQHSYASDHAWAKLRNAIATLYARGWSEASVTGAIELFRQTLKADPNLAIARAQKALIVALGLRMGLVHDNYLRNEALEDAEQAIALEPSNSIVLGYAGCALADLGQPLRAEPLLERAVNENPGNAQAWAALGAVRVMLGNIEDAIECIGKGVRINPNDFRSAVWLTVMSWALARLNRDEEALEAAKQACRIDVNFYPARLMLSFISTKRGDHRNAGAALAEARRIRPRMQFEEGQMWIGRRGMEQLRALWTT